MNKLMIIGNLTKDPEFRTTTTGKEVCTFTVAVNRRKNIPEGQPEADYFRVSAWKELGRSCHRFLTKGKKVCVVGPVSVVTYTTQDGRNGASLEVIATDVEFLSPKGQTAEQTAAPAPVIDEKSGMETVDTDDLPF